VRWDRERTRAFGAPSGVAPLFITLGRRRRDGTYTRVGGRCGQAVLADVLKRLAAAAELPDELRHPHALRHTCATELLRAGATVADVRVFLGHASVKTTSIYLASGEDRQEEVVRLRERGRAELDAALAVALAMADVQRAQLRALACRQEVAALQVGELLAAQLAIAEHDREVAGAGYRVVGDAGLRFADQPLVLGAAERLGRLALAGLGPREPHGERLADLAGGHVLVPGQPAQKRCSAPRDPS
jgi:hypothetical protein